MRRHATEATGRMRRKSPQVILACGEGKQCGADLAGVKQVVARDPVKPVGIDRRHRTTRFCHPRGAGCHDLPLSKPIYALLAACAENLCSCSLAALRNHA